MTDCINGKSLNKMKLEAHQAWELKEFIGHVIALYRCEVFL